MTRRPQAHDWFPRPLPANVVVGEGSWIESSFSFVHYRSRRDVGVRVGKRTGIYLGTFFELGPAASVEVGDYCSLVGVTIATRNRVEIGDHCFVAHEVVFADTFAALPLERDDLEPSGGDIRIGDNVWIGARAVVLGGTRIGDGAIVGAAAVVEGDVPPYSVMAGNPARIVGSASGERVGQ